MIVGVISDTHHNEKNYSQVLRYLEREKVPLLIHCGDWDRPDDIRAIVEGFAGEIYGVLGNIDTPTEVMLSLSDDLPHLNLVKDTQVQQIDERTIAVNHFPEHAEPMARTGDYDAVFHGHTHKNRTEKRGNTLLANPGNVTGTFYPPSFGLWETETNAFEVISLESL